MMIIAANMCPACSTDYLVFSVKSPQPIVPIMNWKIHSLLQQRLLDITRLPTRPSPITYFFPDNDGEEKKIYVHINYSENYFILSVEK